MSTLKKRSLFYYGHTVTTANRCLDFKEGAGSEIQANLKVGSYSFTEFAAEIQRAMREAGSQDYVVTTNRATRQITITAPTTSFTLLAATGSRWSSGPWTLAGFANTDVSGMSRTGGLASGSVYTTQYPVKNYTDPQHHPLKESAAVNVSAAGVVQTISFGEGARMKCNIICITDKLGLQNADFLNSATGLADALTFLNYLITKAKIEFIPDLDDPSVFYKMILDSTKADKNGVAFELNNMGVPDFYETGDLTFRKVLA